LFMRQWIKQPEGSYLCGQIAVAVIAGISLEEAIKVVEKKGCTSTKRLVKSLKALGFECPSRLKRMPNAPPLGIGHLKYSKNRGHWSAVRS